MRRRQVENKTGRSAKWLATIPIAGGGHLETDIWAGEHVPDDIRQQIANTFKVKVEQVTLRRIQ